MDDTDPDPLTGNVFTYLPSGRWNQGSDCSMCTAKPSSSLAHDGTWHDATYKANTSSYNEVTKAAFDSNGSAFYAFGIQSQSLSNPPSTADLSFYIDGVLSGTYTYIPPGIPGQYDYHVLLWSSGSISPGPHTFTLQNGHTGGDESLVLFDYAVYTRDYGEVSGAETPTTSSVVRTDTLFNSINPPPTSTVSTTNFSNAVATIRSSPSNMVNTTSMNTHKEITSNTCTAGSGTCTISLTVNTASTSQGSISSPSSPPTANSTPSHVASMRTRTIVLACVMTVAVASALALFYHCHRRRCALPSPKHESTVQLTSERAPSSMIHIAPDHEELSSLFGSGCATVAETIPSSDSGRYSIAPQTPSISRSLSVSKDEPPPVYEM